MPSWNKREQILGTLWLGLLTSLLYVTGLFIWLTPLPIIYGFKKGGGDVGVLSLGVALLALLGLYYGIIPAVVQAYGYESATRIFFLVPGIAYASTEEWNPLAYGLPYFGFYGAIGLMLGKWEDRRESITSLAGRSLLFLSLGALVFLVWQVGGSWQESINGLETYSKEVFNQMILSNQGQEQLKEQLAVAKEYQDRIIYYAVRVLPGFFVSLILFIIWLNVVAARKVFIKETLFKGLGSLSDWRLSFTCVWILIAFGGLFFGDLYIFKTNFLKILAINGFIVLGLLYFFQGLAILAFFSKQWSLSSPIKLLFFLVFFMCSYIIVPLLLGFGLFDSWFDFRKMAMKDPKLKG